MSVERVELVIVPDEQQIDDFAQRMPFGNPACQSSVTEQLFLIDVGAAQRNNAT
jgi:hypothetical protein